MAIRIAEQFEYEAHRGFGHVKSSELRNVIKKLYRYQGALQRQSLIDLRDAVIDWGKKHPKEFAARHGPELAHEVMVELTSERATEPLRCSDLRPGDIMLKVIDRAFLSRGIGGLQRLSRAAKPYVIHAGVMFDKTYIIEASGEGIRGNDLRVQNKKMTYLVYRCPNTNIARGAANCSKMLFDIHQRRTTKHEIKIGSKRWRWKSGGPLSYNLLGAFKSLRGPGGTASTPTEMDDLLTDILYDQSRPFFCSHFIVYVFQFVAVQCHRQPSSIFQDSAATVHPSALAGKLEANPNFNKVGIMLPNTR
jgi:hypothetical protein